jgi:DNA-binding Xre family transcriptional regulator
MTQAFLKNILVKDGIGHEELADKSGLSSASITKFAKYLNNIPV